jgi:hypothetical protein
VALTIAGDASAPERVRTIALGLVVSPVLEAPTAERLGEDLPEPVHRHRARRDGRRLRRHDPRRRRFEREPDFSVSPVRPS